MTRYSSVLALLFFLVVASLPAPASAQGRRSAAPSGWPPVQVGIHGGYDYTSTRSLLGAQMRIPVHPSGYVELVPNGDVIFQPQFKEYMAGADLVAVSGGRRGGLYVGGGLTWRNTLYDGARATKRVPTIVAGARSAAVFGSPLSTQIEVRWIRADTAVKPKLLTLGINVPLWGWADLARR